MQNVKIETKGTVLTITVDLSKRFGPSSTGKSEIVATTKGNARVTGHDALRIGLNVFAMGGAQS